MKKPEAEVEGRPTLILAAEDREAIADLVADLLIDLNNTFIREPHLDEFVSHLRERALGSNV